MAVAFEQGKYISDRPLRVMLELGVTDVMNKDGTISKTYGTWATKEGNLVEFGPDKPVFIDENMLKLENVQNLIKGGILKRVW